MENQSEYDALELRLKQLLPEEYQDSYEDVKPVSMGSATLKYLRNGLVAWNDVWATFCDLAMAGGPPHKGSFLEPGSSTEIDAHPDQYRSVIEEICRGITMVTGLPTAASPIAGWVRVDCDDAGMAGWLLRAIVMENVAARCDDATLDLPAGPGYRIHKEIKNVVTVIAKTCHYWFEHMAQAQRQDISVLLGQVGAELPLIKPTYPDLVQAAECRLLRDNMAIDIHQAIGLSTAKQQYDSWVGIECPNVHAAIWMMRALVVSNVVSRREETMLFVPVNPASDRTGEIVIGAVVRVSQFARSQAIL